MRPGGLCSPSHQDATSTHRVAASFTTARHLTPPDPIDNAASSRLEDEKGEAGGGRVCTSEVEGEDEDCSASCNGSIFINGALQQGRSFPSLSSSSRDNSQGTGEMMAFPEKRPPHTPLAVVKNPGTSGDNITKNVTQESLSDQSPAWRSNISKAPTHVGVQGFPLPWKAALVDGTNKISTNCLSDAGTSSQMAASGLRLGGSHSVSRKLGCSSNPRVRKKVSLEDLVMKLHEKSGVNPMDRSLLSWSEKSFSDFGKHVKRDQLDQSVVEGKDQEKEKAESGKQVPVRVKDDGPGSTQLDPSKIEQSKNENIKVNKDSKAISNRNLDVLRDNSVTERKEYESVFENVSDVNFLESHAIKLSDVRGFSSEKSEVEEKYPINAENFREQGQVSDHRTEERPIEKGSAVEIPSRITCAAKSNEVSECDGTKVAATVGESSERHPTNVEEIKVRARKRGLEEAAGRGGSIPSDIAKYLEPISDDENSILCDSSGLPSTLASCSNSNTPMFSDTPSDTSCGTLVKISDAVAAILSDISDDSLPESPTVSDNGPKTSEPNLFTLFGGGSSDTSPNKMAVQTLSGISCRDNFLSDSPGSLPKTFPGHGEEPKSSKCICDTDSEQKNNVCFHCDMVSGVQTAHKVPMQCKDNTQSSGDSGSGVRVTPESDEDSSHHKLSHCKCLPQESVLDRQSCSCEDVLKKTRVLGLDSSGIKEKTQYCEQEAQLQRECLEIQTVCVVSQDLSSQTESCNNFKAIINEDNSFQQNSLSDPEQFEKICTGSQSFAEESNSRQNSCKTTLGQSLVRANEILELSHDDTTKRPDKISEADGFFECKIQLAQGETWPGSSRLQSEFRSSTTSTDSSTEKAADLDSSTEKAADLENMLVEHRVVNDHCHDLQCETSESKQESCKANSSKVPLDRQLCSMTSPALEHTHSFQSVQPEQKKLVAAHDGEPVFPVGNECYSSLVTDSVESVSSPSTNIDDLSVAASHSAITQGRNLLEHKFSSLRVHNTQNNREIGFNTNYCKESQENITLDQDCGKVTIPETLSSQSGDSGQDRSLTCTSSINKDTTEQSLEVVNWSATKQAQLASCIKAHESLHSPHQLSDNSDSDQIVEEVCRISRMTKSPIQEIVSDIVKDGTCHSICTSEPALQAFSTSESKVSLFEEPGSSKGSDNTLSKQAGVDKMGSTSSQLEMLSYGNSRLFLLKEKNHNEDQKVFIDEKDCMPRTTCADLVNPHNCEVENQESEKNVHELQCELSSRGVSDGKETEFSVSLNIQHGIRDGSPIHSPKSSKFLQEGSSHGVEFDNAKIECLSQERKFLARMKEESLELSQEPHQYDQDNSHVLKPLSISTNEVNVEIEKCSIEEHLQEEKKLCENTLEVAKGEREEIRVVNSSVTMPKDDLAEVTENESYESQTEELRQEDEQVCGLAKSAGNCSLGKKSSVEKQTCGMFPEEHSEERPTHEDTFENGTMSQLRSEFYSVSKQSCMYDASLSSSNGRVMEFSVSEDSQPKEQVCARFTMNRMYTNTESPKESVQGSNSTERAATQEVGKQEENSRLEVPSDFIDESVGLEKSVCNFSGAIESLDVPSENPVQVSMEMKTALDIRLTNKDNISSTSTLSSDVLDKAPQQHIFQGTAHRTASSLEKVDGVLDGQMHEGCTAEDPVHEYEQLEGPEFKQRMSEGPGGALQEFEQEYNVLERTGKNYMLEVPVLGGGIWERPMAKDGLTQGQGSNMLDEPLFLREMSERQIFETKIPEGPACKSICQETSVHEGNVLQDLTQCLPEGSLDEDAVSGENVVHKGLPEDLANISEDSKRLLYESGSSEETSLITSGAYHASEISRTELSVQGIGTQRAYGKQETSKLTTLKDSTSKDLNSVTGNFTFAQQSPDTELFQCSSSDELYEDRTPEKPAVEKFVSKVACESTISESTSQIYRSPVQSQQNVEDEVGELQYSLQGGTMSDKQTYKETCSQNLNSCSLSQIDSGVEEHDEGNITKIDQSELDMTISVRTQEPMTEKVLGETWQESKQEHFPLCEQQNHIHRHISRGETCATDEVEHMQSVTHFTDCTQKSLTHNSRDECAQAKMGSSVPGNVEDSSDGVRGTTTPIPGLENEVVADVYSFADRTTEECKYKEPLLMNEQEDCSMNTSNEFEDSDLPQHKENLCNTICEIIEQDRVIDKPLCEDVLKNESLPSTTTLSDPVQEDTELEEPTHSTMPREYGHSTFMEESVENMNCDRVSEKPMYSKNPETTNDLIMQDPIDNDTIGSDCEFIQAHHLHKKEPDHVQESCVDEHVIRNVPVGSSYKNLTEESMLLHAPRLPEPMHDIQPEKQVEFPELTSEDAQGEMCPEELVTEISSEKLSKGNTQGEFVIRDEQDIHVQGLMTEEPGQEVTPVKSVQGNLLEIPLPCSEVEDCFKRISTDEDHAFKSVCVETRQEDAIEKTPQESDVDFVTENPLDNFPRECVQEESIGDDIQEEQIHDDRAKGLKLCHDLESVEEDGSEELWPTVGFRKSVEDDRSEEQLDVRDYVQRTTQEAGLKEPAQIIGSDEPVKEIGPRISEQDDGEDELLYEVRSNELAQEVKPGEPVWKIGSELRHVIGFQKPVQELNIAVIQKEVTKRKLMQEATYIESQLENAQNEQSQEDAQIDSVKEIAPVEPLNESTLDKSQQEIVQDEQLQDTWMDSAEEITQVKPLRETTLVESLQEISGDDPLQEVGHGDPAPGKTVLEVPYGQPVPELENVESVPQDAQAEFLYQVSQCEPIPHVAQDKPMSKVVLIEPEPQVTCGESMGLGSQDESVPPVAQSESLPQIGAQSEPVPQVVPNEPEPQVAPNEPEPQAASNKSELQVAQSEPEPQVAQSEPEPQVAQSEPEPQVAQSEPEPQVAQSEPLPQVAQSEPLPQVAQSEPLPQVAQSEPLPQVAQSEPLPQVAQSEPLPQVAQSEPEPQVAQSELLPQVAQGEPKPLVAERDSIALVAQSESKPLVAQCEPKPQGSQSESMPQVVQNEPILQVQQDELVQEVAQAEPALQFAKDNMTLEVVRDEVTLEAAQDEPMVVGGQCTAIREMESLALGEHVLEIAQDENIHCATQEIHPQDPPPVNRAQEDPLKEDEQGEPSIETAVQGEHTYEVAQGGPVLEALQNVKQAKFVPDDTLNEPAVETANVQRSIEVAQVDLISEVMQVEPTSEVILDDPTLEVAQDDPTLRVAPGQCDVEVTEDKSPLEAAPAESTPEPAQDEPSRVTTPTLEPSYGELSQEAAAPDESTLGPTQYEPTLVADESILDPVQGRTTLELVKGEPMLETVPSEPTLEPAHYGPSAEVAAGEFMLELTQGEATLEPALDKPTLEAVQDEPILEAPQDKLVEVEQDEPMSVKSKAVLEVVQDELPLEAAQYRPMLEVAQDKPALEIAQSELMLEEDIQYEPTLESTPILEMAQNEDLQGFSDTQHKYVAEFAQDGTMPSHAQDESTKSEPMQEIVQIREPGNEITLVWDESTQMAAQDGLTLQVAENEPTQEIAEDESGLKVAQGELEQEIEHKEVPVDEDMQKIQDAPILAFSPDFQKVAEDELGQETEQNEVPLDEGIQEVQDTPAPEFAEDVPLQEFAQDLPTQEFAQDVVRTQQFAQNELHLETVCNDSIQEEPTQEYVEDESLQKVIQDEPMYVETQGETTQGITQGESTQDVAQGGQQDVQVMHMQKVPYAELLEDSHAEILQEESQVKTLLEDSQAASAQKDLVLQHVQEVAQGESFHVTKCDTMWELDPGEALQEGRQSEIVQEVVCGKSYKMEIKSEVMHDAGSREPVLEVISENPLLIGKPGEPAQEFESGDPTRKIRSRVQEFGLRGNEGLKSEHAQEAGSQLETGSEKLKCENVEEGCLREAPSEPVPKAVAEKCAGKVPHKKPCVESVLEEHMHSVVMQESDQGAGLLKLEEMEGLQEPDHMVKLQEAERVVRLQEQDLLVRSQEPEKVDESGDSLQMALMKRHMQEPVFEETVQHAAQNVVQEQVMQEITKVASLQEVLPEESVQEIFQEAPVDEMQTGLQELASEEHEQRTALKSIQETVHGELYGSVLGGDDIEMPEQSLQNIHMGPFNKALTPKIYGNAEEKSSHIDILKDPVHLCPMNESVLENSLGEIIGSSTVNEVMLGSTPRKCTLENTQEEYKYTQESRVEEPVKSTQDDIWYGDQEPMFAEPMQNMADSVLENMARPVQKHMAEVLLENMAEPAQENMSEPAQENMAEPAQENMAEPVQENMAEPAQENMAEPAQENMAEPVQENMAEPAQENMAEPAQENMAEPAQENMAEPAQENMAEPAQENMAEPAQENVAEPAHENMAEPAHENMAEPMQENMAEPAQENIAEPAQETMAEPAQETMAEPAQENMAEPAQENMAEPAQENMAEPAQENMAEPAQENMAEPAQENMAEPAQENMAEPAQNITETVLEYIVEPEQEKVPETIQDNMVEPVHGSTAALQENSGVPQLENSTQETMVEAMLESNAEPEDGGIAESVQEVMAEQVQEVMAEAMLGSNAEPVQEVMAEQMQEVIVEPMKEVLVEPAQEVLAQPAQEVMAEPVQEAMADPALEVRAEPALEVMAEPALEVGQEMLAEVVHETMVKPILETISEPVQESMAEPLQEIMEEFIQNSTPELEQESAMQVSEIDGLGKFAQGNVQDKLLQEGLSEESLQRNTLEEPESENMLERYMHRSALEEQKLEEGNEAEAMREDIQEKSVLKNTSVEYKESISIEKPDQGTRSELLLESSPEGYRQAVAPEEIMLENTQEESLKTGVSERSLHSGVTVEHGLKEMQETMHVSKDEVPIPENAPEEFLQSSEETILESIAKESELVVESEECLQDNISKEAEQMNTEGVHVQSNRLEKIVLRSSEEVRGEHVLEELIQQNSEEKLIPIDIPERLMQGITLEEPVQENMSSNCVHEDKAEPVEVRILDEHVQESTAEKILQETSHEESLLANTLELEQERVAESILNNAPEESVQENICEPVIHEAESSTMGGETSDSQMQESILEESEHHCVQEELIHYSAVQEHEDETTEKYSPAIADEKLIHSCHEKESIISVPELESDGALYASMEGLVPKNVIDQESVLEYRENDFMEDLTPDEPVQEFITAILQENTPEELRTKNSEAKLAFENMTDKSLHRQTIETWHENMFEEPVYEVVKETVQRLTPEEVDEQTVYRKIGTGNSCEEYVHGDTQGYVQQDVPSFEYDNASTFLYDNVPEGPLEKNSTVHIRETTSEKGIPGVFSEEFQDKECDGTPKLISDCVWSKSSEENISFEPILGSVSVEPLQGDRVFEPISENLPLVVDQTQESLDMKQAFPHLQVEQTRSDELSGSGDSCLLEECSAAIGKRSTSPPSDQISALVENEMSVVSKCDLSQGIESILVNEQDLCSETGKCSPTDERHELLLHGNDVSGEDIELSDTGAMEKSSIFSDAGFDVCLEGSTDCKDEIQANFELAALTSDNDFMNSDLKNMLEQDLDSQQTTNPSEEDPNCQGVLNSEGTSGDGANKVVSECGEVMQCLCLENSLNLPSYERYCCICDSTVETSIDDHLVDFHICVTYIPAEKTEAYKHFLKQRVMEVKVLFKKENYKNENYVCATCMSSFTNVQAVLTHSNLHDNIYLVKASGLKCPCVTKLYASSLCKWKAILQTTTFVCFLCDYIFACESSLNSHIEVVHYFKEYCRSCQASVPAHERLSHLKIHSENQKLAVEIGSKDITTKSSSKYGLSRNIVDNQLNYLDGKDFRLNTSNKVNDPQGDRSYLQLPVSNVPLEAHVPKLCRIEPEKDLNKYIKGKANIKVLVDEDNADAIRNFDLPLQLQLQKNLGHQLRKGSRLCGTGTRTVKDNDMLSVLRLQMVRTRSSKPDLVDLQSNKVMRIQGQSIQGNRCTRPKRGQQGEPSDEKYDIPTLTRTRSGMKPPCENYREEGKMEAETVQEPEEVVVEGEWSSEHTYVCCACGEAYLDLGEMMDHKWEAHPSVWCAHTMIHGQAPVPLSFSLQYQPPAARPVVVPLPFSNSNSIINSKNGSEYARRLTCSRCSSSFLKVEEFHLHLVECGGLASTSPSKKKSKRGFKFKRRKGQGIPVRQYGLSSHPGTPRKTKQGDGSGLNTPLAENAAAVAGHAQGVKRRLELAIGSIDNTDLKNRLKAIISNSSSAASFAHLSRKTIRMKLRRKTRDKTTLRRSKRSEKVSEDTKKKGTEKDEVERVVVTEEDKLKGEVPVQSECGKVQTGETLDKKAQKTKWKKKHPSQIKDNELPLKAVETTKSSDVISESSQNKFIAKGHSSLKDASQSKKKMTKDVTNMKTKALKATGKGKVKTNKKGEGKIKDLKKKAEKTLGQTVVNGNGAVKTQIKGKVLQGARTGLKQSGVSVKSAKKSKDASTVKNKLTAKGCDRDVLGKGGGNSQVKGKHKTKEVKKDHLLTEGEVHKLLVEGSKCVDKGPSKTKKKYIPKKTVKKGEFFDNETPSVGNQSVVNVVEPAVEVTSSCVNSTVKQVNVKKALLKKVTANLAKKAGMLTPAKGKKLKAAVNTKDIKNSLQWNVTISKSLLDNVEPEVEQAAVNSSSEKSMQHKQKEKDGKSNLNKIQKPTKKAEKEEVVTSKTTEWPSSDELDDDSEPEVIRNYRIGRRHIGRAGLRRKRKRFNPRYTFRGLSSDSEKDSDQSEKMSEDSFGFQSLEYSCRPRKESKQVAQIQNEGNRLGNGNPREMESKTSQGVFLPKVQGEPVMSKPTDSSVPVFGVSGGGDVGSVDGNDDDDDDLPLSFIAKSIKKQPKSLCSRLKSSLKKEEMGTTKTSDTRSVTVENSDSCHADFVGFMANVNILSQSDEVQSSVHMKNKGKQKVKSKEVKAKAKVPKEKSLNMIKTKKNVVTPKKQKGSQQKDKSKSGKTCLSEIPKKSKGLKIISVTAEINREEPRMSNLEPVKTAKQESKVEGKSDVESVTRSMKRSLDAADLEIYSTLDKCSIGTKEADGICDSSIDASPQSLIRVKRRRSSVEKIKDIPTRASLQNQSPVSASILGEDFEVVSAAEPSIVENPLPVAEEVPVVVSSSKKKKKMNASSSSSHGKPTSTVPKVTPMKAKAKPKSVSKNVKKGNKMLDKKEVKSVVTAAQQVELSKIVSEKVKPTKKKKKVMETKCLAEDLIKCMDCGLRFDTHALLEEHQQEQDCVNIAFEMSLMEAEDHLFECPHCHLTFAYKGTQRKHTSSCRAVKYKRVPQRSDGKVGHVSKLAKGILLPSQQQQEKAAGPEDPPGHLPMEESCQTQDTNLFGVPTKKVKTPKKRKTNNLDENLSGTSMDSSAVGLGDERPIHENIRVKSLGCKKMKLSSKGGETLVTKSHTKGYQKTKKVKLGSNEIKSKKSKVNGENDRPTLTEQLSSNVASSWDQWCPSCNLELPDLLTATKHQLYHKFTSKCQQRPVLEVCVLLVHYGLGVEQIRQLITTAISYQGSTILDLSSTGGILSSEGLASSAKDSSINQEMEGFQKSGSSAGPGATLQELLSSPVCVWVTSVMDTIAQKQTQRDTVCISGNRQEALKAVTTVEEVLKELLSLDIFVKKNNMLLSMRQTFEAGTEN